METLKIGRVSTLTWLEWWSNKFRWRSNVWGCSKAVMGEKISL